MNKSRFRNLTYKEKKSVLMSELKEKSKGFLTDKELIKVNTKITKKGKIKFTSLNNFLLYRIVKVFHFI